MGKDGQSANIVHKLLFVCLTTNKLDRSESAFSQYSLACQEYARPFVENEGLFYEPAVGLDLSHINPFHTHAPCFFKIPFVLFFHICCFFQLAFSFYIIWLKFCTQLQDQPMTCGHPGLVNDLAPHAG